MFPGSCFKGDALKKIEVTSLFEEKIYIIIWWSKTTEPVTMSQAIISRAQIVEKECEQKKYSETELKIVFLHESTTRYSLKNPWPVTDQLFHGKDV